MFRFIYKGCLRKDCDEENFTNMFAIHTGNVQLFLLNEPKDIQSKRMK